MGKVMFTALSSTIPIAEFEIKPLTTSSWLITKFFFCYIVALIFAEIGYTLGLIFKNSLVGILTIIAYMFVLPNLGRFDFKNSLHYIANKVFEFYGVISIQSVEDTSLMVAILVMLFVLVLSFIINMIVLVKRSSYNC